jgi:DNA-binding MarR family transcriptional regulator
MVRSNKKSNSQRPHKALPRRGKAFVPPTTITLPPMLKSGGDVAFRETLYLMALTFGRLHTCREAFGRALELTSSQFIVLIGTAYQQGGAGVSIRALADHTQLAATHVTTEVGRLIDKGLLTKEASTLDRRSVLVRLSPKGQDAIRAINPLLRRVNDLLFADVSREEFAAVSSFLERFALNSEYALAEIRRSERQRSSGGRWPRNAGQD